MHIAHRRLSTLALCLLLARAALAVPTLTTVDTLDVERYMGRWVQIALLPNWFQRRCVADTTAMYALNADGTIAVTNRCRKADGEFLEAHGVARPNPRYDRPGILQVRFAPRWLAALPLVWGDYWVMAVTEDYGAALVGAPNRQYLWVLARTPTLDDATYARLVDIARREGFDVTALVRQ